MKEITERFIRYARVGTTSCEDSDTYPSTPTQLVFAKMLVKDCLEIGLSDVHMDPNGYVLATLPANMEGAPVIGLISHMDTAPAAPGDPAHPQVIHYTGGDILLNEENGEMLRAEDNPELKKWIGSNLVVTDGNTLLGADDKAGITEILEAVKYLLEHPEIGRGEIRIAFTPDEEIGRGTKHFNVPMFGAEAAYTVDGGALGELEYENFNAATAEVLVHGVSIHTGSAKNKMKNALLIAHEFQSMMPQNEIPACTEGREGFFHLRKVEGGVELTRMIYNIREHDNELFLHRQEQMKAITDFLNLRYGEGTVELSIHVTVHNMLDIIRDHMDLIEKAREAFGACDVPVIEQPIRGGTDGARLSFMGLPCPNLSTGGMNFHSRHEWIAEPAMEKMRDVLIELICQFV